MPHRTALRRLNPWAGGAAMEIDTLHSHPRRDARGSGNVRVASGHLSLLTVVGITAAALGVFALVPPDPSNRIESYVATGVLAGIAALAGGPGVKSAQFMEDGLHIAGRVIAYVDLRAVASASPFHTGYDGVPALVGAGLPLWRLGVRHRLVHVGDGGASYSSTMPSQDRQLDAYLKRLFEDGGRLHAVPLNAFLAADRRFAREMLLRAPRVKVDFELQSSATVLHLGGARRVVWGIGLAPFVIAALAFVLLRIVH